MLWEIQLYFSTFDGVVNTLMIYKEPIKARRLLQKDGYYFDLCYPQDKRVSNTQAVLWLEKLCKEFNADIVITSTWRKDYGLACECLYNSGLSKTIRVIDKTPWLDGYRGAEIDAWLKEHPCPAFVILDDDTDMEPYMDHLVKTDFDTGITVMIYERAKQLLQNQLSK
jgi:hypothetical protein